LPPLLPPLPPLLLPPLPPLLLPPLPPLLLPPLPPLLPPLLLPCLTRTFDPSLSAYGYEAVVALRLATLAAFAAAMPEHPELQASAALLLLGVLSTYTSSAPSPTLLLPCCYFPAARSLLHCC
jgi:hypothetical protein